MFYLDVLESLHLDKVSDLDPQFDEVDRFINEIVCPSIETIKSDSLIF